MYITIHELQEKLLQNINFGDWFLVSDDNDSYKITFDTITQRVEELMTIPDSSLITYINNLTGLSAGTVQDALDEFYDEFYEFKLNGVIDGGTF